MYVFYDQLNVNNPPKITKKQGLFLTFLGGVLRVYLEEVRREGKRERERQRDRERQARGERRRKGGKRQKTSEECQGERKEAD